MYEDCGVIYASGMNSKEIGQAMEIEFKLLEGNVFKFSYELDFSAFDSS